VAATIDRIVLGGGGGGRVFTSVAPLAANVSGGTNSVHSTGDYGATPGRTARRR